MPGALGSRPRFAKLFFDGVYYGQSYIRGKDGGYQKDENGRYIRGEAVVAVRCGGIPEKKLIWDEPYDRNKPWSEQKTHYEPYDRKAILPLKRVYKLATELKQFDGTRF